MMAPDITINLNELPDRNVFSCLRERIRYNNHGILRRGFLGLFIVKNDALIKTIEQDFEEMSTLAPLEKTKHIYPETERWIWDLPSHQGIIVYNDPKQTLPMKVLLPIITAPQQGWCVAVISPVLHPKIFNNADFTYKEDSQRPNTLIRINQQ